ncbi:hypothetical protein F5Y14DRAFT_396378 [Nemania sp. NC0429]|nr:hypothetical protein F5Y14DRAFT_396378 [Nemania sp. NC0429]
MAQAASEQSQLEAGNLEMAQRGVNEETKAPLSENPPAGGNAQKQDVAPRSTEGDRKQSRGFCNPFLLFFGAMGSLFAGIISLSATAGQGMTKFYWHIPILYGDKTAREWPEITGFRSGCAAGGRELFYGFYDGITGVVTLPYKGAKGAGIKGFGIGVLHGFAGLLLKPLTGFWALIGHPIYGLHKHISNRKASRQQQDSSELV